MQPRNRGELFSLLWVRQDVAKAERYHTEFPTLVNGHLTAMRKKQTMHGGDRSHTQLRALDALVPTLSYPGWQQDVASGAAGKVRMRMRS